MNIRRLTPAILGSALLLAHCASTRAPGPASASRSAPPAVVREPTVKLTLPNLTNAVRFAVIGDSGTGRLPQYEMARQMADCHKEFPFDFVLMLGDNIYGGKSERDFERKFSLPYKPLLDAGVQFYASLGNHDSTNERYYKLFNMNGQRYYTFKKGNARFFALDSNYLDPGQLQWLETQLRESNENWKICFFHQPLYSDGRAHGADLDLRVRLEPLLEKYNVSVVFSGHDHVYERIKPRHGTTYFIVGDSGQLRFHNLQPSAEMAAGFDKDRAFVMAEIARDDFYFETVARTGEVVDSGTFSKSSDAGTHQHADAAREAAKAR